MRRGGLRCKAIILAHTKSRGPRVRVSSSLPPSFPPSLPPSLPSYFSVLRLLGLAHPPERLDRRASRVGHELGGVEGGVNNRYIDAPALQLATQGVSEGREGRREGKRRGGWEGGRERYTPPGPQPFPSFPPSFPPYPKASAACLEEQ